MKWQCAVLECAFPEKNWTRSSGGLVKSSILSSGAVPLGSVKGVDMQKVPFFITLSATFSDI